MSGDFEFNTVTRKHDAEEKVTFASGATSSKIPHFEYIPRAALISLANRFELGQLKHGAKAWNPLKADQSVLDDKEFITARLAHVIDHATKALEKLHGRRPDDGDDDAGAIMWGGACLAAALERREMLAKQPYQVLEMSKVNLTRTIIGRTIEQAIDDDIPF